MWGRALWALTGNATASLAQWAIVVFLARRLGYRASGDYALALAIVNPVMMLANLQLRAVQASDAAGRFRFTDYLCLRFWTTVAAAILIAEFGSMATAPATVLTAVLGMKAVEAISDVYHGAFQRAGKLEWIAQSQITRSALTLALVIVGAVFDRPLVLTLGVAAGGSALVWLWYDCGQAKRLNLYSLREVVTDWPVPWMRLRPLVAASLPLGIVMMLVSLQQSIPRFALERFTGREALGAFAAVTAITQGLNLALNAIGQALTNPLARLAHARDVRAFRALFGKGFLTGAIVVVVATATCAAAGSDILRALYGRQVEGEELWLTLQMAAAGVTALAGLCGYALTAMGQYRIQLLVFLPLTTITAVACWIFVPEHGVEGACWACLAVSVLHLAAVGFLLNLRMEGPMDVDSTLAAQGVGQ